ncbi:DnaB-like helicase N-terminal domain-containing protein [Streptomyces collinus]|uniref:DnaB-like helicase N-terminal domain-containing protein n=1 Tax=Streptomyces collinus TaxID=42684 RepID=UPI0037D892BA
MPLHAGLWQCLTTLARRREPIDPVTVLWEAQQRGQLDDGHDPGRVLHLLAEPAGSVGHLDERAAAFSWLPPSTPASASRRRRATLRKDDTPT